MNPHQLPQSTIRRVPSQFAIFRFLRSELIRNASIAAGLAIAVGSASADPPLPAFPVRPAGVSDAVISRNVLLAIDAEPELRVNLFVSVVDGVAVIGGPVSSPVVSKRAEEIVRNVPGIKDVRNGCFVTSGPDPFTKAVAERLASAPPRPTSAELPGVLTGPKPPVWGTPSPAKPSSNSVAFGGSKENTVVVRKPPLTGGDGLGLLGAPVGPVGSGLSGAPNIVRDPSMIPATAPGRLTAGVPGTPSQAIANDILTSAGNAKRVEARFARLTVELQDGILVVGGSAPQPKDVWEFAEKLSQIPGVTRVVVRLPQGN